MWHLVETFFEQSWVLKLFNLWGWLCVLIMVTSIAFGTDFNGLGKDLGIVPQTEVAH
jgi:hypothetical protein